MGKQNTTEKGEKNKKSIFITILDFFYELFGGKKNDIKNVRRVYFGLRFRLITTIGILLLLILFLTTIIFVNLQKKAILDEKFNTISSLAKTLGVIFESYIDTDINTNAAERQEKFNSIRDNCNYFKSFNSDIFKIFVTNEKGVIIYSTYNKDINKLSNASYVTRVIKDKKVDDYIFKDGNNKYRAITYPIFISKGNVIEVLNDFDINYDRYYESNKTVKNRIVNNLKYKYKSVLGETFFKDDSKDVIQRNNDIDFVFLKLFTEIMKNKQKRYKRGEEYLWNEKWLYDEKNKILKAKNNDLLNDALKTQNLIKDRLKYLKSQIEEIKLLGTVAILTNLNDLNNKANKNTKEFVIIFIIIGSLALIIISILIWQLVKNLKILQMGAQKFALGDFDSQILIKTNDETGRLSDILNNMAIDIKEKLHMEKFISRSTKSMIKQSSSEGSVIQPGTIKRVFLSFIFADVRGFTSFSEENPPEVVVDTLNLYFQLQYDVIRKYNGDIDDYVGDQIMAHFGGKNSEETSCKAALEIKKAVDKFNDMRMKKGLPTFQIGIGVHSGVVVVGNIGSFSRMDFACVGDAVNTTSRLCGKAEPGEIIVSDQHAKTVFDKFKFKEHQPLELKGKKEKMKVWTLVG